MKFINPRYVAELITKGVIPPQFIGEKSFLVLKQEIFSLINRYSPETMTEFEKLVFGKDVCATVEGILKLEKKDQRELFRMFYLEVENFYDSEKISESESKTDEEKKQDS